MRENVECFAYPHGVSPILLIPLRFNANRAHCSAHASSATAPAKASIADLIRVRVRSRPSTTIVSKSGGVAVLPVIATRMGMKSCPAFHPKSAANPRRQTSICSRFQSSRDWRLSYARSNASSESDGDCFFATRSFGSGVTSSAKKKSSTDGASARFFRRSCSSATANRERRTGRLCPDRSCRPPPGMGQCGLLGHPR